MSRIFITGSCDGLGFFAAKELIAGGHQVVIHGRSEQRIQETLSKLPGAEAGLFADLSEIAQTINLAKKVNELGTFDAVIHNAAVGYRESHRKATVDGLPELFAVNSLAPYLLTALIVKPKRSVYLSSGLHQGGDPSLTDLTWEKRPWKGFQAYSDSKLHDLILSQAIARLWPHTFSNALEPGWVATKMGGPDAPDNLQEGYKTQCWLATGNDNDALLSGRYFFHRKQKNFLKAASNHDVQDLFLESCRKISGVSVPG